MSRARKRAREETNNLVLPDGVKRVTSCDRNHPEGPPAPARQRRSKEDVAASNKALAKQQKQQEDIQKAVRCQSVHELSQLEDAMHQDQQEAKKRAERPDLPSYAAYRTTTVARHIPSSDEPQDVDMEATSSGPPSEYEGPPLSDSDGLAMDVPGDGDDGDESSVAAGDIAPKDNKSGAESDNEEEEIDLLSDEESQKIYRLMQKRMCAKKAQVVKGAVREEVNQGRKSKDAAPVVPLSKLSSMGKGSSARVPTHLQGLKKAWKQPAPTPSVDLPSQNEDPVSTSSDPDAQPLLRHPKSPIVNPPANSQAGKPISVTPDPKYHANTQNEDYDTKATKLRQKKGTTNMGLTVAEVGVSSTVKAVAVPSKVKATSGYKIDDLEFTHIIEDRKKWSSSISVLQSILPPLYDWLGTQCDLFSVNAHPQFEAVLRDAWDSAFNGDWEMDKVAVRVAGASTRSYKSGFVKRSFKVVASHFIDQQIKTKDSRAKEVKRLLANDTFIYKEVVGEKRSGAYRGPLLMMLYARHQRTIDGIKDYTYGDPAGALAWCATALERALSLWKKGDDPEKGNFVRNPWDKQLGHHFKTTSKLKEMHWDTIKSLSREIYQSGAEVVDSEGKNDDEETKEPKTPAPPSPEIVLTNDKED
ncbi:hypothetical protein BKA70DRAFT_1440109 [Coprinopsis sp. MPI-PUGE-AT-0042]|nr:hypothetical protein BKA70DRAFT_1440109 [Coprinopsis sp. MPI-PUGE-AT-0042]